MWYSGYDGSIWRIGYATSLDGTTWTRSSSNPVLVMGPPGTWDDNRVYCPNVLYDGVTYHMWYSGYDGTYWRNGYASSSDGESWTKDLTNPALDIGGPGTWDSDHVSHPSVISQGNTYHMWYSGNGSDARIGYAIFSDEIEWTKLTARTEVLDAYEITGLNSGSSYTIDLEVPSTADLDMFIYDTTGGRDDAVASSKNVGSGIDESLFFTAPSSGDYLLIITNENGGTGKYTISQGGTPPVADAGEDQTIFEGQDAVFNVTGSFDPDGDIVRYDLDFGDGTTYTWESTSTTSGKDILVFITQGHGAYNRTYFDGELPQILSDEGFNVDVSGSDEISEITPDILGNYDQFWIMSTRYATTGLFSQAEIDAILNFQKNGGGLLIMADHTLGASYAADANQISSNYGVTFSGFVNHGHTEIDPFLFDHPLNENVDYIWGHWSESYITESDPDVEVIARYNGRNMIAIYDVPGEGRIVFDSSFVRAEDKEDTNHNITCADNIQYMKNIAKWLGQGFGGEPPPLIYHPYGDDGHGTDGIYTMTLTVTDNEGMTATDTSIVTVLNVDPTITIEPIFMDVEISLRMAGSKWSNAEMTLYEEDRAIGFIEVERWPGSPDKNPYNGVSVIPLSLDLTKNYSAVVTYDPYPDSGDTIKGDQPNNGKDKQNNAGNPVWVVVKFSNGSEERAHHTFNTQQSKKRGSTHPNHVDPWEVDIMELLKGHSFEVSTLITDPGSDDIELTFTYGTQILTKEYLNDPPNPDPYPSPEINPRDIIDITELKYEGEGTLVLAVSDDDGGEISVNLKL